MPGFAFERPAKLFFYAFEFGAHKPPILP
jgi:hypothetical protein